MPDPNEAELTLTGVNVREWGPTEDDEEQVLASLGYVLDEETGIYESPGEDE